ncbi:hypothetical protein ACROYT_G016821 [Oculina patagonica]
MLALVKQAFVGRSETRSPLRTTAWEAIIGRALPIHEKPESPGIEPGASNARIIVLKPSTPSENSSEESFPGEGIKRPMTGSESNASFSPSSVVEEPKSDDDIEELGHNEDLNRTARTRELGFRRMRAAEESRRASQNTQEDTGTASSDGEETGDEDDGETTKEETTPPPIPRICWQ